MIASASASKSQSAYVYTSKAAYTPKPAPVPSAVPSAETESTEEKATASDLARELEQLQKEFSDYTRSANFSYAELALPTAGGFVEKYRRRTAEIQKAICRLRLR